ncbi:fasciclin domain-containing protein [Chitinophaga sp. 22620]|uniref:fasciclin domain-containing protein n=1 Tax=Chitinophaga sp. 22620 TaxID=3453952 RepID=UPI003F8392DC
MKFSIRVLVFLSLALLQLNSCKNDFLDDVPETLPVAPKPNMAEYLKYNYSFSMLYDALVRTGLESILADPGKDFTLLAPDNAAFAASGITPDSLGKLDPARLKDLISYHILPGKTPETSIPEALNTKLVSIHDRELYVSKRTKGVLTVNGVRMRTFGTTTDIPVANGVVHVLTNVLALPPASVKELLMNDPDYSRFTEALGKFGLLDKLAGPGPFVVLALNNDFFISQDELDMMDTLTYKKYVFDAQILENRFFFFSDFSLRMPSDFENRFQYYIKPEGALVINTYDNIIFAVPVNAGPSPDYYTVGLGDQQYINGEKPGKLAVNGTVIDCTAPLVYPYNMTK